MQLFAVATNISYWTVKLNNKRPEIEEQKWDMLENYHGVENLENLSYHLL